jgi:alpha-tubulin suppressor-like RCC1 family protein
VADLSDPSDYLTDVTDVTAGGTFTCARLGSGTAKCWGANYYGQLGDGTTGSTLWPVAVADLTGISSLTAGSEHVCARLDDGSATCWGWVFAEPAGAASLSNVTSMDAGSSHTCARLGDGTVSCWGYGALGQDSDEQSSSTPVKVQKQC